MKKMFIFYLIYFKIFLKTDEENVYFLIKLIKKFLKTDEENVYFLII